MPRRDDLHRILILGSGPIRIGQAAEFDFSGSQACRALREDGYEVILVNSNPATIQNDPDMADLVYIEPLLPEVLRDILEKERPDALLAGMGGQTALNIASELAHDGTLDRLGVELIGCQLEAIDTAEDRDLFKQVCEEIGLPVPRAVACHMMGEVLTAAREFGSWPLLVRPAFTLGGLGGGIVHSEGELVEVASLGLRSSRISQVLIEESLLGWQEHEYEVMRDEADNAIIVCTMENLDPMGVHTGESIVVAPCQTLSDADHQQLRDAALRLIRRLDIRGGCNVQFTVNQTTGEWRVIEVNPRVSRSSALASKATGYPIARIAARIAVGWRLDELVNPIIGENTTAAFEPTLDYCVVKIPRWPFDKFRTADRTLGTSMKSTGEVMAIGRSFEEAVLKALASLEQGCPHPRPLTLGDVGEGEDQSERAREPLPDDVLVQWLSVATDRRLAAIIEALRRGWGVERVNELTGVTRWFLRRLTSVVEVEAEVMVAGAAGVTVDSADAGALGRWKRYGLADSHIADALAGFPAAGWRSLGAAGDGLSVMRRRHALGLHPTFRMVDSCAAEFAAKTPYYYSTWEDTSSGGVDRLGQVERHAGGALGTVFVDRGEDARRLVVVGSGPIRIGQGIEFDYSCVHGVQAIREAGHEAVLVNNNPETVSTDFDTSDRLYFEPLTLECVTEVLLREGAEGVLLQFGGQTAIDHALPLNRLQPHLAALGVVCPVLGTSADSVDEASDRARFEAFAERVGLTMPAGSTGHTAADVRAAVEQLGFPVLIRPSYVLGGRGMEILTDERELEAYLAEAYIAPEQPLLVDTYLGRATELDVDAVCDGEDVLVGAVMEHIEEAGIHSGDSTCFIPPQHVSETALAKVRADTRTIGLELGIIGSYNIQFAIQDEVVHVLEVNPRASRTVPFVAKATGLPLARLATRVALGERLADQHIPEPRTGMTSVKAPVFPFLKLRGLDPAPGPEMKSTGEVMGSDADPAAAYLKARMAAEASIPTEGGVYVTVRDEDKQAVVPMAASLADMGFTLHATPGTADAIRAAGVPCETAYRIAEPQSPDALDLMRRGQIQLVINTPTHTGGAVRDGNMMRRLAVELGIPFVTTLSGATMEVAAIAVRRERQLVPVPLA